MSASVATSSLSALIVAPLLGLIKLTQAGQTPAYVPLGEVQTLGPSLPQLPPRAPPQDAVRATVQVSLRSIKPPKVSLTLDAVPDSTTVLGVKQQVWEQLGAAAVSEVRLLVGGKVMSDSAELEGLAKDGKVLFIVMVKKDAGDASQSAATSAAAPTAAPTAAAPTAPTSTDLPAALWTQIEALVTTTLGADHAPAAIARLHAGFH